MDPLNNTCCFVCYKVFSRRDSLIRHMPIHERRHMLRPRRKACLRCTRMKLKCLRERPSCSSCTKRRAECRYDNSQASEDRLDNSVSLEDARHQVSSGTPRERHISFLETAEGPTVTTPLPTPLSAPVGDMEMPDPPAGNISVVPPAADVGYAALTGALPVTEIDWILAGLGPQHFLSNAPGQNDVQLDDPIIEYHQPASMITPRTDIVPWGGRSEDIPINELSLAGLDRLLGLPTPRRAPRHSGSRWPSGWPIDWLDGHVEIPTLPSLEENEDN
ncbi:hypothetical protein ASPBRDRAFT_429398 [Aspergillus brasiliensis CBS 101740]|uniref:Zn(2)-C6 fungal-type domain-containing protein n=1 Tax=Aspergillus brasiliensis (strain CBS 101740 / IMI 381727 / IBT 21946) TaxID=767769 RepID=A0A1L9U331_ASPBC|nr:hypothetical protein ASPBRDRAFT_429398 [Aspergillus brasiliensis CBS 101740]